MLRVVTTNNAEIFRHFGARVFQAHGVEQSVGTEYGALLQLVRTKHPDVVILDVELPERRTGYELCRAIKDDPALGGVRVMIALASVVSRAELQKLDACGCDDVLALPLHTEDFYAHVAHVTGLPFRRHHRVPVGLGARFDAIDGATLDRLDDLSLGGLGVVATGALERGQWVRVALQQGERWYEPLTARVAWTRADGDALRAGLHFTALPIETRLLVEQVCLFDAVDGPDGVVTVALHGNIAEQTDLRPLAARVAGAARIDFNMREVRYMSSIGVRTWVDFLAGLAGIPYAFRHASIAFVSQVAMMPAVAGHGRIMSFEAPYRCEPCDREDARLLETGALLRDGGDIVPPALHCGTCGAQLVFDDLPQRYLAFALTE